MAGLLTGSIAGSANGGNSMGPYFEYKVMPLLHNLDQKSGSDKMKDPYFLVGDLVEGKCKYNDKTYKGRIQRILKDENGQNSIIYILTSDSLILPLKFNTIKRLDN